MEYTFMFKLKLFPEDFFNICIKRKVEIKKLDKLPKLDNNYLLFIAKYQEVGYWTSGTGRWMVFK